LIFTFLSIKYGVSKSTKMAHDFTPTEEQLVGTIEDIFHSLVAEGKVADTEAKKRNISLCLYAYEVAMVSM
jgi:hypothetical protein